MSLDFTLEIDVEDFCASMEKLDKATRDYVQDALVQATQAIVIHALLINLAVEVLYPTSKRIVHKLVKGLLEII